MVMILLRVRIRMRSSLLKLKVRQKSLSIVNPPSLFRELARDREPAIIRWL